MIFVTGRLILRSPFIYGVPFSAYCPTPVLLLVVFRGMGYRKQVHYFIFILILISVSLYTLGYYTII